MPYRLQSDEPTVQSEPLVLRDLLTDTSGQAATEYALLLAWTVLLFLIEVKAVKAGLLDYYQDVASLICLPIP